MGVKSLRLSSTPFEVSESGVRHEYVLVQTGMTDVEVYRWLQTENAQLDANGVVERPDGMLLTSLTSTTPILSQYSDLPISSLRTTNIRDADPEYYRVWANYESQQGGSGSNLGQNRPVGSAGITISVEATPEIQKVDYALETIFSYQATNEPSPPDMKGAINVDSNGVVRGVQVPQGNVQHTLEFTQDYSWFSANNFSRLQKLTYAASRSFVNSANMTLGGLNYSPGEVRFQGVNGTLSSDGQSSLQLQFGIIENATFPVEGIVLEVVKKGWDYFWIYRGKGNDGGRITAKPLGGYVVKIFPTMDLNGLLND